MAGLGRFNLDRHPQLDVHHCEQVMEGAFAWKVGSKSESFCAGCLIVVETILLLPFTMTIQEVILCVG